MKYINLEDVNTLYLVDIDEYHAAAIEGAEEHHFTLDGQEVLVYGSKQ